MAMNLDMTWGDVAEATGGTLVRGDASAPFSALSTDTRRLGSGQAFWALSGDRHDAHEFLDAELARRCSGWVVRRGAELPRELPARVLEVGDTRGALADLARKHRERFQLPVVGVTGTNGKTTVKEMLRAILSRRGAVCANSGNFNNEIGLPLSVLELGSEARFGLFELGASRRGDIRFLARVARPTAAVLTNVGPAHLEFFGDEETVFRTKSELVEELPEGGPVALNGDDPWLRRLLPGLGPRAVLFGSGKGAECRVRIVGPPEAPLRGIALDVDGHPIRIPRTQYGWIHRLNAAAAAAGALAVGLLPGEIEAGLLDFEPAPLRFVIRRHASGAVLVVDTYNANPASMRAGVETFLETSPNGQRVVVLGEMRELGGQSLRLHRELGEWLAALPLAGAYLVGEMMEEAAQAMRRAEPPFPVEHAADAGDLAGPLKGLLRSDTRVYFKASRALALEGLVERL